MCSCCPGRAEQIGLAVQRPLVISSEPLAGVVIGADDGGVEPLPGPVLQLVDQHGHEHGLAGLLGPDRNDEVVADLAEVNGKPAAADRADLDGGVALAAGTIGRAGSASCGERRGECPCVAGVAAEYLVDLWRAAPPVWADPAGAAEPRLPPGDLFIAVRAVRGRAGQESHRILISPASGGKRTTAPASDSGAPGSTKQASQPGPFAGSTDTVSG